MAIGRRIGAWVGFWTALGVAAPHVRASSEFGVPGEIRTFTVGKETRTFVVSAETRTFIVPRG